MEPPKVPARMKKHRKEQMKQNGKLQDEGCSAFQVFEYFFFRTGMALFIGGTGRTSCKDNN